MNNPILYKFPYQKELDRSTFKTLVILLFLFSLSSINSLTFGQDQEYEISGSVVDETTGDGLVGANIQIENTTFGAAADAEGQFEFTAEVEPGTYNLNITYLGFQSRQMEVELADESSVDLGEIELTEDFLGIDEIVVTGTTTPTTRRELGNAVSSVNAQDIETSGATTLDRAISGKISGAQISQSSGNASGGVSIRLRGTSTVLGAAEPLYIVDGVIVNNDSPELIDIGGGSQNRIADINPQDIERIEVVKGAAAAALYGSRANNGVIQIFTKRGQSGEPRVSVTRSFNVDQIRKTLDVNTHPTDAQGNDVERYDHQEEIFRTAPGTNQFISVSGGSEDTQYYVSGSYLGKQGISRGNNYQRGSGRLRLDQKINPWLDATIGANYTRSNSSEMPHGGVAANYGALTGFIFGPNTYDPSPDENGVYPDEGILANPREAIDRYDFSQDVSRFIGDVQLNISLFENAAIDYTLGYDTYTQTGKAFIPIGTSAPGLGSGFSRRSTHNSSQVNNDVNIRVSRSLSETIESRTLMGGTLQYENFETITGESQALSPVTKVSSGGADQTLGESRGERVLYGIFAQQTFNVNDLVFVTGAGRFDASSAFSEEERWQFYPKVSASYLLSEHDFWQDSDLSSYINDFTLRASVGASGGLTAIGPFDRFTTYPTISYGGNPGLVASSSLGTLGLRPERQREIEVGFDLSTFSNRLYLEMSLYDQHISDLLLNRSLAPTSGYLTNTDNVGELTNRGIEIRLRGIVVDAVNTRWISTLTYSANRNEVDGVEGDFFIAPNAFGQVAVKNGEPLGVFFSTPYARDENGNIIYDENGIPQAGDEATVIGDPNPDFIASWINEVDISDRWNFRAQFDATYGNDVFNFTRRLAALPAFGTLTDYQRELEGELPAGYNAATFNIFEHWVEDGSFIKLRELSASRFFYPDFLGIESLRISLIGRNLFSIDDYSGYDPETNVTGQSTVVRGFDFVEVPIPRSISLSISANF